MKQVYTVLLLLSFQGFGQDYARQTAFKTEKITSDNSVKEYEIIVKKNETYTPGLLNNIPAAVLDVFTSQYPGAINVTWFLDENQTTVYCNWENELVIAKYKNDGQSFFTRKTYTIEKMDRPFSDFLKREIGTKHDVNYITEFIREDSRNFEISMSNDKEWLTVKLTRDKVTGVLLITEKKFLNK